MLIAADKFKGSLTAVEVAEHLTAGIRKARPEVDVEALPVADGGDGTVAAAVANGFTRHEVEVTGPLGASVTAAFALREGTAVVEMAEAAGLQHLPPGVFVPLTATTYGAGELLLAAVEAGATTIIFGVGGSATTDGGAGMLDALGARLLDEDGDSIPWGGGGLRELVSADLSGMDPRLKNVEVVLASDVDNPLTGPKGAAAVYGPQKGATDEDVKLLDAALAHFAETLGEQDAAASPGAGAAGGIGFGALV
ncbi:glycerate kinase, partial [Streptomyces nanshensis]